jgi:hypothetical protein
VTAGAVEAPVGDAPIKAAIAGTLPGLMHPGQTLRPRDKPLAVDPGPPEAVVFRGIGLGTKTNAEGILAAITGVEALSNAPVSRKGTHA